MQKFKFAEDVVDYVGFTLTRDEIKVAASMTESIRTLLKQEHFLA